MPGPVPRSPLSVGIGWASRVSTIGLMFGLPPLVGNLLDVRLGTKPVILLVGMALGFAVGMMHLLRLTRERPGPD